MITIICRHILTGQGQIDINIQIPDIANIDQLDELHGANGQATWFQRTTNNLNNMLITTLRVNSSSLPNFIFFSGNQQSNQSVQTFVNVQTFYSTLAVNNYNMLVNNSTSQLISANQI